MKIKIPLMVCLVLIILLGNNMNADLFKDSNIKSAYFAGGCFWGGFAIKCVEIALQSNV
jgi:hypothetical protein